MRVINIYLQKLTNFSDIKFESSHPKYQTDIQQHFTKPESLAKVKLLKPLFNGDSLGNIISADDL